MIYYGYAIKCGTFMFWESKHICVPLFQVHRIGPKWCIYVAFFVDTNVNRVSV